MPMSDTTYAIIISYDDEDSDILRLKDINTESLTEEQVIHLTREMIEILLNLNSHNATCNVVNDDCFLLVKNKDVKVDLFYLSIF
jgi:hypothetical protein